ncbi:hypothetical protein BDQ94DRAFT_140420 [Aspergillus welwitschiae]|uniref:Uncharacterized protein n=1 Tax=Aspergillus welwitschiae TaxID=1341132 RepID=A0A3F3Q7Q6_9EURO|nr:hypothetical protein BDQ94DRAFT_140420 [Aspergillus welwitschiae]RDH35218.1 hypothetical protein BDQ94DRAFT_140420 [Aspergillus welwitschiae]
MDCEDTRILVRKLCGVLVSLFENHIGSGNISSIYIWFFYLAYSRATAKLTTNTRLGTYLVLKAIFMCYGSSSSTPSR